MSGKVLVIDSVATNRIVLKVKLSSAFYYVLQATTATEALSLIKQDLPHVVLCAADLPDGTAEQLVSKLRRHPGGATVPVVVLVSQNQTDRRLSLLQAGADEVLAKPCAEIALLARLRRLTRRRQAQADMALRADAARALGFAEAPAEFATPGRIAMIDTPDANLHALYRELQRNSQHHVVLHSLDMRQARGLAFGLAELDTTTDLILIPIGDGQDDPGLAKLVELRSAEETRHARIIAHLSDAEGSLAASVLDMGADDAIDPTMEPGEVVLRLHNQIHGKQGDDQRRNQLQTGLQAAVIDPLTGLYNRRFALAEMKRLIEHSSDTGASFTVMVADLDHFKSVNDTYGHAAGDMVLAQVANKLRATLTDADMVARIGGEEFLILLPDSGQNKARATADLLCNVIRDTEVTLPGQPIPLRVTISIGVTVAKVHDRSPPMTTEMLLLKADQALYGAKSEGRDTVTFNQLSAA